MRLSRFPQSINNVSWYYEEKHCIDIVYEARDKQGKYLFTDHIKIPKWKLIRSLKRMGLKELEAGEMFSIKDIKTMKEKTWVKKHVNHGITVIHTQGDNVVLATLHCKKCNEIYVYDWRGLTPPKKSDEKS